MVSSIYDPLGICAPFTLKPKLLLQEVCKQKLSWDDSLQPDDVKMWTIWLSELSSLKGLFISRCLFPRDISAIVSIEIHIFCDASSVAFDAVGYLRLQYSKCTLKV